MKVFVAGATGAIGKQLVPRLISGGHEVIGMTRSAEHVGLIRQMGAKPVVADALDRDATIRVMVGEKPDVVVHQLTALAGLNNLKNFDDGFAVTNRLRTEGTDNLLSGARAAGASLFVAQSYGGWTFDPDGPPLKNETSPFIANPPVKQRRSLEAIKHVEQTVATAKDLVGTVLRYGNFYGPGTGFARDGDLTVAIRKRQIPVIGSGAGVWSFVHSADAATAVLAAMQVKKPGVFNIADDEPAPVAVWLPEVARIIGAGMPRHFPAWLGRLIIGDVGVAMMTKVAGMLNAKAKRELGWQLTYPSWRNGFSADFARS